MPIMTSMSERSLLVCHREIPPQEGSPAPCPLLHLWVGFGMLQLIIGFGFEQTSGTVVDESQD